MDYLKITAHWGDEDDIQKSEGWKRDDIWMIWNSQSTELFMRMVFRAGWGMEKGWFKDYLKLTAHWAVDEDDNQKDEE